MLVGWAPLFFSIAKEKRVPGDVVDLLVFQSGSLKYPTPVGPVHQSGGCIPPDLHESYRRIVSVRAIRCAGDTLAAPVGQSRIVARMAVTNNDGTPFHGVHCYKTVHAGLSFPPDEIMRASDPMQTRSLWADFRRAFLTGVGCNAAFVKPKLPSVFVIARKALGLPMFGNRMFSPAAIATFNGLLLRLQRDGVIGRFSVGDMDSKLLAQGCTFAEWSIVIGVHGNGFGWTPLLPPTR